MAIFYVTADAPTNGNGDSWNTPTSLQTALGGASADDEIWLVQGTYTSGNTGADTFTINQAIQIYGGFNGTETDRSQRDWQANQTILSGGNINDHVITAQSTANAALIDGVIIQDGNAIDDGGGVLNQNNGKLTIQNTIVQDNRAADDGGGIRNDGELNIINSTVTNNTSIGNTLTSGGGGLLNTIGASVNVVSSTFSGNTATNGGAIRNDGTLNLINSTLSGNTATESGGGLANTIDLGLVNGATAIITSSTLTNNQAQNSSGQPTPLVGGGVSNFGDVTVTNSIIAGNVGNDDIIDVVIIGAATSSGSSNVIGNGDSSAGLINGNNGDQVGSTVAPLNPQLEPLQANSGFTQTHAPQTGSPVIDAGNVGALPTDDFDLDGDSDTSEDIPVDQRGIPFARIVGPTIDIGATESQTEPLPAINLTPTIGLVTTEAGSTANFTAVLASQPSDAVTLNFTSDDPSEGTVIPNITFTTTNWNTPQTVVITGVDDADDDGDIPYIINTDVTSADSRYSTLLLPIVSVTNQDDNDPGVPMPPTPPTSPINPARPRLTLQGERIVVDGGNDVSIEISISQNLSEQVREVLIFETDSSGTVEGLVPSDAGYLDAVLSTAQVVFSTLESGEITALVPNRTITASSGSVLQFGIIDGGSLDSLRRGTGGVVTLAGISSQSGVVELQELSDGSVQVGFRQGQTGMFDQLILTADIGEAVPVGAGLQGLSRDSELIDLRDEAGILTITVDVYREAKLDNVVGLFTVENEQGQVRDALGVLLSPGDAGYTQAALAKQLALNLTGNNNETVRYTSTVLGGQLLSTFLVVDGMVADLLDSDVANDPAIYFTHVAGNSDRTDHVRLLGNNTLGFEDIAGGGDLDFDDLVIQTTFA